VCARCFEIAQLFSLEIVDCLAVGEIEKNNAAMSISDRGPNLPIGAAGNYAALDGGETR
jgi:hypothetical protein